MKEPYGLCQYCAEPLDYYGDCKACGKNSWYQKLRIAEINAQAGMIIPPNVGVHTKKYYADLQVNLTVFEPTNRSEQ